MTRIKVPPPISAGVLLSYKCSARCLHCLCACSPDWEPDWISTNDLEQLLTLLAPHIQPALWGPSAIGVDEGLHFTGGEPFLNYELLLQATQIATALRIPSTFVETNASWCTSDAQANDWLSTLKDAGLNGILISANPFYAEYVPFENTRRCIRIAHEVFGNNVIVYQMAYYYRLLSLGITDAIPLERYLNLAQEERLGNDVEIFVMGRVVRDLREFYPKYSARTFLSAPCRPPVLREWHNHFDNYGNFIPGYCGGISVGHWRDLEQILQEGISTNEQPVLGYLLNEDIAGLYHFAQDYGYREPQEGYISKCDLCLDLRQHLIAHEDFPELQPATFYQEMRRGAVGAQHTTA